MFDEPTMIEDDEHIERDEGERIRPEIAGKPVDQ